MTVQIPYTQWFTVLQWMTQNYIADGDYTVIKIQDRMAVTFSHNSIYSRFYHAWHHIIYSDYD